ncbi:hypothetical protein HBI17_021200 [Parastagonospora nodorum]|nr:hypothetical protein HBI17_021200 [Parastagonospora nodorum]
MAVLSTLNGGVQALMDTYLWDAIHLDAPAWWLNPIFMTLWDDKGAFEQLREAAPQLTYAPGLIEVLGSPTPPTLDYFKSLPAVINSEWREHWAIYAHIYELEGRKPRIYIGSATAEDGATSRLVMYEETANIEKYPRFVKKAFIQGFRKTRSVLLAWSDIPLPGVFLRARQRYLGLEGIFQMLFFASIVNNFEPEWVDFMPWCREDVEWEPLCSHISLNESAKGDFSLSTEELEFLHAAKLKHRKVQKSAKNRRYRVKYKAATSVRGKEGRLAAKASGKHKCMPCNITYGSLRELNSHLRRSRHKKIVEKLERGESLQPSAESLCRAKRVARNLATKRFHCDLCDKDYRTLMNLKTHYTTALHLNAAALADAELADPDLDYDSDADRDELDNEDLDTDLDGFQVSDGD